MQKLTFILIAAAAVLTFQSCGKKSTKKDSKALADSINRAKELSGNTTADTSASAAAAAPAVIQYSDSKFAVDAADGSMAEVDMGNIAQQKATTQALKDFGTMMMKDHSKANEDLLIIAKNTGIALPQALSDDEKKIKDGLFAKSGTDFDKAYISTMIEDHKKDIKEFEDAGKQLKSPDLKAFAIKTLPVLKMHLAAIQKIAAR